MSRLTELVGKRNDLAFRLQELELKGDKHDGTLLAIKDLKVEQLGLLEEHMKLVASMWNRIQMIPVNAWFRMQRDQNQKIYRICSVQFRQVILIAGLPEESVPYVEFNSQFWSPQELFEHCEWSQTGDPKEAWLVCSNEAYHEASEQLSFGFAKLLLAFDKTLEAVGAINRVPVPVPIPEVKSKGGRR